MAEVVSTKPINRNSEEAKPSLFRRLGILSLRDERLDRLLTLTLGFMSFIPILLVTWAIVHGLEMGLILIPITFSVCVGYIVARRMVFSVQILTKQAGELASGKLNRKIAATASNEIGQLARHFNRITGQLENKIEELESSKQLVKKLLQRIGTAIVSYQGIDNVLNMIVENAAQAMEAQRGTLMLVEGERQELSLKTCWTDDGSSVNGDYTVKMGNGLIGRVAKEGKALYGSANLHALGFKDVDADEDWAILSVPLRIRDNTLGVVTIARKDSSRAFTEDEESLVTSISSQMAVAIENYRLNLNVERTYIETIMALAVAVEAKDPYSAGHSKRVGFYASKIGEKLGHNQEFCKQLSDAGILHDIGKIGIKDDILLKNGPLDSDEWKIMKQHVLIGEAIVKPVKALATVVPFVRHHHERIDGKGYPDGLVGENVPYGARILAVADAYDAMATDRPYRKRLSRDQIHAELRSNAGTQHDKHIVKAFLEYLEEQERLGPQVDTSSQKDCHHHEGPAFNL